MLREGGGGIKEAGGQRPPASLENLSPPPAWLPFAEDFLSPGEPLAGLGVHARAGVGLRRAGGRTEGRLAEEDAGGHLHVPTYSANHRNETLGRRRGVATALPVGVA